MDADDLLMKNAIESLYKLAEEYQADVISMHRFFYFNKDVYEPFPKTLEIQTYFLGEPFNEPEIEPDNIAVRIQDLWIGKMWVTPWSKFSRRDLLIEKEIFFPNMKHCEDDFWSLHLICEAKKIFLLPKVFYIQRRLPVSFTHGINNSVPEQVNYSITTLIQSIDFICRLKEKINFLNDNPQWCYILINHYVTRYFYEILNPCINLNQHEMFKVIFEEFVDRLGDQTEVFAALCTTINTQQKQLYLASQKISELEKRLAGI